DETHAKSDEWWISLSPIRSRIGDESRPTAPTGRDSIAQGGQPWVRWSDQTAKPQRGEIPIRRAAIPQRVSPRWGFAAHFFVNPGLRFACPGLSNLAALRLLWSAAEQKPMTNPAGNRCTLAETCPRENMIVDSSQQKNPRIAGKRWCGVRQSSLPIDSADYFYLMLIKPAGIAVVADVPCLKSPASCRRLKPATRRHP